MLILSRVCVDFHNKKGELVHRVNAANRLCFHEAPDSIQEDPIFQMLVNDGSLEAGVTAARKRTLETDPTAGTTAEGRRIAAPSGGNSGDPEVTRNERDVRGTVATIEGADQKVKPEADRPETKTDKAETKAESKPETKTAAK